MGGQACRHLVSLKTCCCAGEKAGGLRTKSAASLVVAAVGRAREGCDRLQSDSFKSLLGANQDYCITASEAVAKRIELGCVPSLFARAHSSVHACTCVQGGITRLPWLRITPVCSYTHCALVCRISNEGQVWHLARPCTTEVLGVITTIHSKRNAALYVVATRPGVCRCCLPQAALQQRPVTAAVTMAARTQKQARFE